MKLGPNQENTVNRLKESREHYNKQLAQLDANYTLQKETLKRPIRELIIKAKGESLPDRQIHLALGFSQISGLTNFLRQPLTLDQLLTVEETYNPDNLSKGIVVDKPLPTPDEYRIIPGENGAFDWIAPDGTEGTGLFNHHIGKLTIEKGWDAGEGEDAHKTGILLAKPEWDY